MAQSTQRQAYELKQLQLSNNELTRQLADSELQSRQVTEESALTVDRVMQDAEQRVQVCSVLHLQCTVSDSWCSIIL